MTRVNLLEKAININDNLTIPALLFGTYKINESTISLAIERGFYAFDMAAVYRSEDMVFSSIKKYIDRHEITNARKTFYFCYKLDATMLLPTQIKQQVTILLSQIEAVFPEHHPYIDMLVVHAPNHQVSIEQTWNYMQELVADGKVLNTGVSNFNMYHLKCMLGLNLSTPLINQIELNPFFTQTELTEYCAAQGIKISAYRSARNKATQRDLAVLQQMAADLGIHPVQIINSWKFTKGHQVVAISRNPEHIAELKQVQILSSEYIRQLDAMDKGLIGRTCDGEWASFDFTGHMWHEYEKLIAI